MSVDGRSRLIEAPQLWMELRAFPRSKPQIDPGHFPPADARVHPDTPVVVEMIECEIGAV